MSVKGTVKDGVIVLQNGAKLPDGAEVEVITTDDRPLSEEFLQFAGTLPGPADFARNHDHYIYGTSKK